MIQAEVDGRRAFDSENKYLFAKSDRNWWSAYIAKIKLQIVERGVN